VSVTQTPLSAEAAVLIGLLALAAVAFQPTWAIVQHIDVMAHEGAHAIISSLSGCGVKSITIARGGGGATKPARDGGTSSTVAIGVVGYVGPSLFGLGAAALIQSGYILSMFWLALFLLAILLIAVRWSFGFITVPLAGILAFLIAKFAPAQAQVIAAYALTWLLLSAVRSIIELGLRPGGDSDILRSATGIGRLIWSLLWLAGALAALAFGGRMLVMPT
jgi:peptidase M50B-like protein